MFSSLQFNFRKRLPRRTMLRGAGVSMAIPYLSAMQNAFAAPGESQGPPKRFVAMTLGLGLHGPNLNPDEAGTQFKPSRYLKALEDMRSSYTVVSGSSLPGVTGGHRAEASILTAQPLGSNGNGKNSISLDQYMAKHGGGETRFPSLVLSSGGSSSPSYTENGSMIPAQDRPSRLFDQLFVDESESAQQQQANRVREGRSIMDLVSEDAKRLARSVGAVDRDRLDAYFTSVRDLETRMAAMQQWAVRPKPKVDAKRPVDIGNSSDFIGRQRLMSDMIRLALETDSTRYVVYHLGGSGGVVPLPGVDEGYHSLSHHGLDDEKLEQLAVIETAIIEAWGDFLRSLGRADDQGHSLLDQTAVLLTSNLGNASNHSNQNMPVLLAGGGFKHGRHLAFDVKKNYPLSNLYVSLLQDQGFEVDQFASGTTTMKGLEFKT
ncbi:MAG: DUF1552 domain-containing protein [Pirellulaceae bacterium]